MAAIADYVRNIAVFLIFSSFVTIIMPGKKYEQYINLILGIILIFLVTAPLAGILGLLSQGSGDIFRDIGLQYDRAVLARQIEGASEAGEEAILAGFKEALTQQVERVVVGHGYFVLQHVEFEIDRAENFGEILSMHLEVKTGEASATPLITIDPVRINFGVNTLGQPVQLGHVESPQIMSLKNALSDFYNLDKENIILETRD